MRFVALFAIAALAGPAAACDAPALLIQRQPVGCVAPVQQVQFAPAYAAPAPVQLVPVQRQVLVPVREVVYAPAAPVAAQRQKAPRGIRGGAAFSQAGEPGSVQIIQRGLFNRAR